MKMQTLRSLYDQLTPAERLRLLLAALAREDADEVGRLDQRCPRVTMVVADPAYTNLRDRLWETVSAVLFQWLDVSHRVVRTRQAAVAFLHRSVLLQELLVGGARGSAEGIKRLISQDRAAMVRAETHWTQSTLFWKAIEAAITRFCAEQDLTTEQLFAMVKSLPPAIDEARANLDPDVPADPHEEVAVYRRLCDTVSGYDADGS